ncbi:MAG: ion transporter, partial [Endomicrobium sp.]|nr:ion transporter [Endomicrobium sp.]
MEQNEMSVKSFSKSIILAKWFEIFIGAVITVNCILIGVETYLSDPRIYITQQIALLIFIVEISLRFLARDSVKSFFSYGWNIFDLSLIIVSVAPESLFAHPAAIMSLRILRVFRILRLVRTSNEIKLIITVLIRSLSALVYNALFFAIFLYLFAIIGLTLFKLPVINAQTPPDIAEKINYLSVYAPNSPSHSPDPYGN